MKASLGFGLTLAGFALLRSIVYIARYGLRSYLRSTFDLDPHAWMIIGILLFVAIASMAGFVFPGFPPWTMVP
jgi:hypothetical protein